MGALQGCMRKDNVNAAGTADGGGGFTMDYGPTPQANSSTDGRNTKSSLQSHPENSLQSTPKRSVVDDLWAIEERKFSNTTKEAFSPVEETPAFSSLTEDFSENLPGFIEQEEEEEDTFAVQEFTDTYEDMASAQVKIQKPAPFFKGTALVNGEFKEISLDDYKGKYVVLFFYPLDFTFVCPTEIIAFSDRAEDFRKIGCELIAASTDSQYSHFAWVNTPRKSGGLGKMDIPLLADKSGEISKKYGIYKEDEGIAFRGLFIIDAEQKLRQITVNDLPVGRSVDETLRLVQAFQFTDKHGEVCPAGWKPGSKTIKPTVEDSKGYFNNGA